MQVPREVVQLVRSCKPGNLRLIPRTYAKKFNTRILQQWEDRWIGFTDHWRNLICQALGQWKAKNKGLGRKGEMW